MFESIVSDVVNKSIDNFSVTGIENLDQTKGYLFISNHRDITLDSALLNLSLHKNNLNTTNNAVGNNLLSEKWASDLMRLNKSFIIDRSDKSKREIYKSLNLASEFMNETILKNNHSVWIAQKQGRSKDGNDYTDPSVIKMIHLHARKKIPVHEYLNSLNIIPISISYEKDPNDITKTNELYLTNLNKKYTKEPKEDLKSIAEGIRGQKGDVNLHIGSVMEFTTDSYEDCSDQITTEIKRSYKLHATNYAAALMQGKKVTIDSFNENQIDDAIQYLNRRMLLISEEMQPYFLNQYSNPTNV
jgi:1-acyl-sn-glycerol-3-phosphate acyltransferase